MYMQKAGISRVNVKKNSFRFVEMIYRFAQVHPRVLSVLARQGFLAVRQAQLDQPVPVHRDRPVFPEAQLVREFLACHLGHAHLVGRSDLEDHVIQAGRLGLVDPLVLSLHAHLKNGEKLK